MTLLGAALAVLVACAEEMPTTASAARAVDATPSFTRSITQVPPLHPAPGTYPVEVSGLDARAALLEVERVSGLRLPVVPSGGAVTILVSGSHPDILSPEGGHYAGVARLRLPAPHARWNGVTWQRPTTVLGADIVIHPEWSGAPVVVLHELGHFLGLGHVDGDEYVMSVTSPDGLGRFHPAESAAVEWLFSTVHAFSTSPQPRAFYACGGTR